MISFNLKLSYAYFWMRNASIGLSTYLYGAHAIVGPCNQTKCVASQRLEHPHVMSYTRYVLSCATPISSCFNRSPPARPEHLPVLYFL